MNLCNSLVLTLRVILDFVLVPKNIQSSRLFHLRFLCFLLNEEPVTDSSSQMQVSI